MAEIFRYRTIRPSSRLETSNSYKVKTEGISENDILIVTVDHETRSFIQEYRFLGKDLLGKRSINFRVIEGKQLQIRWSGINPSSFKSPDISKIHSVQPKKLLERKTKKGVSYSNFKFSLDPIENSSIKILILGTMPGDNSLKLGEYYAHPGNRFWKIISTITNNELPLSYPTKKKLLLNNKIGLWDVLHKASRTGSLDSSIKFGLPNNLMVFIKKHRNLKIIGFNGKESERLYDKYFKRHKRIKYILLPSTSPANTSIRWELIVQAWGQIII